MPAQRVQLKTDNSRRRVPMMPIVRESLTALLATAAAAGRDGEADLVFVTHTGRPMSQRNVAGRGVGKAASRAGLGKISPHDLRRSFCSLAGRRGIDPIIAANITGHSLATWQSAYARDFGKQHRDEAREKLLAAGFGSVR
jgi:integrase